MKELWKREMKKDISCCFWNSIFCTKFSISCSIYTSKREREGEYGREEETQGRKDEEPIRLNKRRRKEIVRKNGMQKRRAILKECLIE